jgi:pilus assembly protein CpaC
MGVGACLLTVAGSTALAQQQQPTNLPPFGSGSTDVRPAVSSTVPLVAPTPIPVVQPTAIQPGAAQPGTGKQPETLPQPRPVVPIPVLPGGRTMRVPGEPGIVGSMPKPTPETIKEYGKFVEPLIAPANTLDLELGQTRLMKLKDVPKRIQIADEAIATYTLITPTEMSLQGRFVGKTVLNFWFTDPADKTKEKVLSYVVRVYPDGELKARLERAYKALEVEINGAFLDSHVTLILCGEKLLVCGQAKDIAEATHILEIVRANAPSSSMRMSAAERNAAVPADAIRRLDPRDVPPGTETTPGAEDYLTSGGPLVVNLLKVPGEQQVSVQVTVAEVNRAAARSIGLNFAIFNKHGAQVVASNVGGIVPVIGNQSFAQFIPATETVTGLGRSVMGNIPVALDNGQVQLAISALRELNYSRLLAEPMLTTMNGQTASFHSGDLFPIPYLTGNAYANLEGVGFIPVGVQLSFTPYITDRDRIRLVVTAEVSERDPTLGATIIAGSVVPSISTRTFQTTVELREGQTLAVAGLIQNRLGASGSRIPLFGDIPIIGRLFSFDRIDAQEEELVFLITPELVHPMEPKQIPQLPGCDLFEPGDLEFYLCGRLESRRSYDFRSPVMTDCGRIARYQHCEQLYIQGNYGHFATGMTDGGAGALPPVHPLTPPVTPPAVPEKKAE